MIRNTQNLANDVYDLVIIGGGIYGACAAWEGASRGLKVALLEKKDFGSGTSANSLKIIHGGFRYLQHADIRRLRESSIERRALMRIAPHLVHPLKVVMPAYGHAFKGKEALGLALIANDLLTADRNQLPDPQKHIPAGRVLGRKELLQRIPGIPEDGLSGGIIFYDAQVYNSERLVLSFLHSASQAGAELANYLPVTGFLKKNGRICGVTAHDAFSGSDLEIQARLVVNTSGPWITSLEDLARNPTHGEIPCQAKAVNLVTRQVFDGYAVGLRGNNNLRDKDALVDKGGSFLFAAPWRNRTIVGTTYKPYCEKPAEMRIEAEDVRDLLAAFNQAYPAAELSESDVGFVHAGLLPASSVDMKTGEVQLSRHYKIQEHSSTGLEGLISVEGVKYTTARRVMVAVVDRVFRRLGYTPPPSMTDQLRLHGGEIDRFEQFIDQQVKERPCGLGKPEVQSLVLNYGSSYPEVLTFLDTEEAVNSHTAALIKAEVMYALHHEMAQTLSDVVYRRTEMGTAGRPPGEHLALAAQLMGDALGWDETRRHQEIEEINEFYNFTRA